MRNVFVRRSGQARPTEKGTAAVEFAIVGVWLVTLLGAIIEGGLFLLVQLELQNAADTAARLIRTNQVTTSTSLATFKSQVCEPIQLDDCASRIFVDVRNAGSFADLATVIPVVAGQAPTVGPGQVETFDPGAPGSMGSLVITYDWNFIFPFMTIFSNQPGATRRLYGISVFRIET